MNHDTVVRFLDNLDTAIKFHQTNSDDPHNVGNAVVCALSEVRQAFAKANHMEAYSKDVK